MDGDKRLQKYWTPPVYPPYVVLCGNSFTIQGMSFLLLTNISKSYHYVATEIPTHYKILTIGLELTTYDYIISDNSMPFLNSTIPFLGISCQSYDPAGCIHECLLLALRISHPNKTFSVNEMTNLYLSIKDELKDSIKLIIYLNKQIDLNQITPF